MTARISYYYWVRALSGDGVSALSYVGMGYAELADNQTIGRADLTIYDLVFLPVNLTNNSPAGTVSYRLLNLGPDALSSAPVRFDFYMVSGGREAWMAYNDARITLAAGAEQLIIMDAGARNEMRVRADLAGQYKAQVRARHLGLIGDRRTGSNMADSAGTVLVRASGVNSIGRGLNDYDGDGKADGAVFSEATGKWLVALSGTRYGSWLDVDTGGANLTPAPGDYDGDGITDMAFYDRATGYWLAQFSSDGLLYECWLGGAAFTAAPSDWDGDAKTDPVVYREADGWWKGAASSMEYALGFALLGEAGYQPVIADYDGDGLADPAVYNRETGRWSLGLSGNEYRITTDLFGGAEYLPAPADYDGDGLADPAVYAPGTADWQVLLSGSLETEGGYTWWHGTVGSAGGVAVPSDYDGDGKADLAVYHPATGLWQIFLSTGGYREISGQFGGAEYQPAKE